MVQIWFCQYLTLRFPFSGCTVSVGCLHDKKIKNDLKLNYLLS